MSEVQVGERLVFVNAEGPSWLRPLARICWAARHRTLKRACVVAYTLGVDQAAPAELRADVGAFYIVGTCEPTVTIAPERPKIGGKE